jgi:hypothetical protein
MSIAGLAALNRPDPAREEAERRAKLARFWSGLAPSAGTVAGAALGGVAGGVAGGLGGSVGGPPGVIAGALGGAVGGAGAGGAAGGALGLGAQYLGNQYADAQTQGYETKDADRIARLQALDMILGGRFKRF